jgi:hypothetical protein
MVDLENLAGKRALDSQPAGCVRKLDHGGECAEPFEIRLGGSDSQQRMDFGREPELIADMPIEERNLAHPIADHAEAEPIRFEAHEAVALLCEHLQRLRLRAVAQEEPTVVDLDPRTVGGVDEAGDLHSAATMKGRLADVPPEVRSRRFESGRSWGRCRETGDESAPHQEIFRGSCSRGIAKGI